MMWPLAKESLGNCVQSCHIMCLAVTGLRTYIQYTVFWSHPTSERKSFVHFDESFKKWIRHVFHTSFHYELNLFISPTGSVITLSGSQWVFILESYKVASSDRRWKHFEIFLLFSWLVVNHYQAPLPHDWCRKWVWSRSLSENIDT